MPRVDTVNTDSNQFRPPDYWAKDEITYALDRVTANMYYTGNRNRGRLKRLAAGMKLLREGVRLFAAIRGRYQLTEARFQRMDCVLPFYMSCRIGLHAAATLTFGHHLGDAAKTLRGAVESAFYGYHVYEDPGAGIGGRNALCTPRRRIQRQVMRREEHERWSGVNSAFPRLLVTFLRIDGDSRPRRLNCTRS